jgi:tetratricopeptide (TPR) repeat protein
MLEQAIALHRQGRLAEAEEAYRAILGREPENAEVGHLLGLLALDAGLPQHAVPVLQRVCMLAPGNALYRINLGVSYLKAGNAAEALQHFDRAVALAPEMYETHFHRGLALKELQRWEEAAASFSRAAEIQPGPPAFTNRGLMLSELRRFDEALEDFRRALESEPDNPMLLSNCGMALVHLGRHAEAAETIGRAAALAPEDGGLHYNHGDPLMFLGRLEEALECYDRAIALRPDMANAHVNRGLALSHRGRIEEALESFDRAIALAPDLKAAHIGRSGALAAGERVDEALAYNRELARNPAFRPDADFHSAFLLLQRGEWEEGWKLYEARRQVEARTESRIYRQPEWLGESSLEGKTLYVYGEQGLGDTIHFCRYLALAQRAGARVVFSPQDGLAPLMAGLVSPVEILPHQTPPDAFDLHMPLISMPMAFGTRPETIPADIPYLRPDPALVAKWRARIGDHGFRIGLCWAGSANTGMGIDRSFPLAAAAPLAAIPGVRLISLQKTDGLAELAGLPTGMTVETLGEDFDASNGAFVDTAAAMQALDLVISCDTSVAHLAGATGRPGWIALKRYPEWRWILNETSTPWYPGLVLFRQKTHGDWPSVFAAMAERLAAQLGAA